MRKRLYCQARGESRYTPKPLPGADGGRKARTTMQKTLALTQTLLRLDRELEGITVQTSDSRFVRSALRTIGEALEADLALQVDFGRGENRIESRFQLALTPAGAEILRERSVHARAFDSAVERLLAEKPIGDVPRSLLVVAVGTVDRRVAALGFVRPARDFGRDELRWLLDAAERVGHELTARHRERARALRERISTKIFSELRPKDVLYQTLHGLKKLFRYDHSGAVLLLSPDGSRWTVQAEIIAWTKAKSERIGIELPLDPAVRDWLAEREPPLLLVDGRIAPHDAASGSDCPEALLRAVVNSHPGAPRARACLLGVLRRKDQVLGLIQLLARHPHTFTREDERTLSKFLPLASVTVYNSELYAQQHDRMVIAERQVGLAELTRAISHDLNNAFGVFLPLLQTVRRDLDAGNADPVRLRKDIEVALHYAGYSARIFKGLLSMGRGPAEPFAWTDPAAILAATAEMIAPNLAARRIETRLELAPVPRIWARRGELEQLFINLLYNARDAMSQGGTLVCRSYELDGGAALEIIDSGPGIPDDLREKIFEPFFTTKEEGTGLGLDICRSIVWEYGGRIELAPADAEDGNGNDGEAKDRKANDGEAKGRAAGTVARVWLPPTTERATEDVPIAASDRRVPAAAESRTEPTVGFRTKSRRGAR